MEDTGVIAYAIQAGLLLAVTYMGINELLMGLVEFLGTYLIHSTVLLGAVLLVHALMRPGTGILEVLYRTVLVAPVLTAVLSVNLAIEPLAGTIRWLEAREVTAPAEPPPPAAARLAPVPESPATRQPDAVKQTSAGLAARDAGPRPQSQSVNWRMASMLPLLPALLAASWLLVAGLLTLRWLAAARAGRRLLADRYPLASGPAHEALLRLTSGLDIQAPALSVSDALGGPATLPSGEICLPRWAMELPTDQLEAMLAHELAHVTRHDSWWLAVAISLESLFWLQPLNRLARRRLAGLAEFHADAWAAEITRDSRALARCLASVAERMSAGPMPALAAAMARRGGVLSERVRRLINKSTQTGDVPMSKKFLVFAGVVSLVMVLPSVAVLANKGTVSHGTSINIQKDSNGTRTMSLSFSDEEGHLRLRASGDIVFAADDSGIEHLGEGSELEIRHETGGVERELLAEGTGTGIEYTYQVDGDQRPYDSDARAWFENLLPMVMRETAINAPERVEYILANHGHDGVLAEIGKINSDFARKRYVEAYTATGRLPDDAYDGLLVEVEEIGSDFELRNALGVIYDTQGPRGEKLAGLIAVANGIGSDFEMRQLLAHLAHDAVGDESVMSAYAAAAQQIGSDFELRQALEALIGAGDGPAAVEYALSAAGGVDSDFEMRSLLAAAAPLAAGDPDAADAWLEAAATIGSDFELRQALESMVEAGPESPAVWEALLLAARDIGSDHESSSFLLKAAGRMPEDPAVEEAFRSVMETIGSDRDYRRVARALER